MGSAVCSYSEAPPAKQAMVNSALFSGWNEEGFTRVQSALLPFSKASALHPIEKTALSQCQRATPASSLIEESTQWHRIFSGWEPAVAYRITAQRFCYQRCISCYKVLSVGVHVCSLHMLSQLCTASWSTRPRQYYPE